jgi:hypothetical protein
MRQKPATFAEVSLLVFRAFCLLKLTLLFSLADGDCDDEGEERRMFDHVGEQGQLCEDELWPRRTVGLENYTVPLQLTDIYIEYLHPLVDRFCMHKSSNDFSLRLPLRRRPCELVQKLRDSSSVGRTREDTGRRYPAKTGVEPSCWVVGTVRQGE